MKLFWRGCTLVVALSIGVPGGQLRGADESSPARTAAPGAAEQSSGDHATLAQGRSLFAQQCASCHALAHDGIGPPLGAVTRLLDERELVRWIRQPNGVIESGDARAGALWRRYKVVMPSFQHLSDAEITAILSFIEAESAAQNLSPLVVDISPAAAANTRLLPPVQPSGLVIELEDVVEIPRLPQRPAYKGIAFLRADPRVPGALLVSELMGLIYRVVDRQVSVFFDVREFFPDFMYEPGVASGLGSFALHPEFAANGVFYTTHSELMRGNPAINSADIPADAPAGVTPPLEWVLTEWRLADPSATSFAGTRREVLRFVTPTTAHGSQEIDFAPVRDRRDPDFGRLYLCIGDGGSINLKRPDMAGHPRTLLGAILRIDPAGRNGVNGQYGIPQDNPFAGSDDPTVRQEIWAYGFRNPHRVSWDFTHGRRMIAIDIGEANVEEINLIEPGGSYGWGVGAIEGTARIDVLVDAKVVHPATAEQLAPFRLPHGQYDHTDGQAVTGGFVYHGPLEALRDKYVFGDIVNGRVFFMHFGAELTDRTIYELAIVRDGTPTTIKQLAHAERAHMRFAYDERTGDMYILTKDDGMVRRIAAAYRK